MKNLNIEHIDTIKIIVDNLKKDEFAIGIEKSKLKCLNKAMYD